VPQLSYITGDCDIHDMAVDRALDNGDAVAHVAAQIAADAAPGFIASGTSYVYVNKESAGYDVNKNALFQVSPGWQYDLLNSLGTSNFIA
jgi:hypothetical protein